MERGGSGTLGSSRKVRMLSVSSAARCRTALAALLGACALPTTDDPDAADVDEDGFTVGGGDCDDRNDRVNPEARERSFDGVDSNCDGAEVPKLGADRFEEALALLDGDGDGAVSLAEFEAACATSALLFGEGRPGVVQTHVTCAGVNFCRGFILHPWLELYEHDCRGVNTCAGWSCVETAEDRDLTGVAVFRDQGCADCHGGDPDVFRVQVPPGEDVDAWVEGVVGRSDAALLSAVAFGFLGISPGGVAASNMPGYHERLSRREMEAVVEHVRTLDPEGVAWQWPDDVRDTGP